MLLGRAAAHVRDRTLRGLLIVLPLLITVWLLKLLFGLISDNVTPVVLAFLAASGFAPVEGWVARALVPLTGVVLTVLLIYLLGLVAANLVGRRLVEMVERGILRVPVVKSIYGGSRQLLDALNAGKSGGFSRVVLVEYPRPGLWTIAFVTNESNHRLPSEPPNESGTVFVFLPTTPNPTSGWLLLVPKRSVVDLDMTIEEAVKLVVSGGILLPSQRLDRFRARAEPIRDTDTSS